MNTHRRPQEARPGRQIPLQGESRGSGVPGPLHWILLGWPRTSPHQSLRVQVLPETNTWRGKKVFLSDTSPILPPFLSWPKPDRAGLANPNSWDGAEAESPAQRWQQLPLGNCIITHSRHHATPFTTCLWILTITLELGNSIIPILQIRNRGSGRFILPEDTELMEGLGEVPTQVCLIQSQWRHASERKEESPAEKTPKACWDPGFWRLSHFDTEGQYGFWRAGY